MRKFISLAAFSFAAALACAGTMTDSRDGHVYETVQIGNQTWMASNLKFDVNDSYCYNHSDASCGELGPLYSMIAARNDVCPAGWILPSEKDVLTMLKNVKDFRAEFKPVAGGFRTPGDDYYNIGVNGYFWTSTKLKKGKGKYFYWDAAKNTVKWLAGDEFSAMSVRCLKKNGGEEKQGPLTDPRDNKVYKTINVNGKTWMAENLAYQTKESICYEMNNSNCDKYGRLYNLNEAKTACPAGWHLSTEEEYVALLSYVRKSETRSYCVFGEKGNKCDEEYKRDREYWRSIAPKLEKLGFSTRSAGYRSYYYMEGNELFDKFQNGLVLWATIPTDMDVSHFMEFLPNGNVERVDELGPFGCVRSCGTNYFSVRCVKD